MPALEAALVYADRLAPFPAVATQLLAMVRDGAYDSVEVGRLIRRDEMIAATVLRAANAPGTGAPGRIFSLQESVVRLGARELLRIILQHVGATMFAETPDASPARRRRRWRDAIGGALTTERLARHHGYDETELCFVAALLRDVGSLVLDLAAQDGCTFVVEASELGAALASRWLLPSCLVEAIRFAHDPPRPDASMHDLLFDLVHAGDVAWSLHGSTRGVPHAVVAHVGPWLGDPAVEAIVHAAGSDVAMMERSLPTSPTRRSA
ncbi:MAG: HDOD domain-containing protein [Phycisphaerales bacterium]|nr:HDOD domain-containing protein [Phycisphaerales bacterium]